MTERIVAGGFVCEYKRDFGAVAGLPSDPPSLRGSHFSDGHCRDKINDNLHRMVQETYLHSFFGREPNARLGDLLIEHPKSSIQVNDAKGLEGPYPFFTSGEAILRWNEPMTTSSICLLNTGGNADVKFYTGAAAYSTDTWCISAVDGLTEYLYMLFQTIRKELDIKFFTGTGLKHLQKPLLKDRPIYRPTTEETKRFNQVAVPAMALISENIRQNCEFQTLRDWLLPMLMNGQATVEAKQPNYRLSKHSLINAFVIIQCDSLVRRTELHMKESLISDVLLEMKPLVDGLQLKQLEAALQKAVANYEVLETSTYQTRQHADLLDSFISAKRVEGCSERTLDYYRRTIEKMQQSIKGDVRRITTEELRGYLASYQSRRTVGKVTIDNVRRILSSFFSWLEDEDFILKSPVRRIHKVRTTKRVKETYTDEELETMRDASPSIRDLALIDLLASTGMRVGEVTLLNRSDIDFDNRECVVLGKGSKERTVYFDARTKIHLEQYLAHRNDQNPALFVSLGGNHARLGIGGIEARLRKLGKELGITKLHPHKFRRTLATMAIDKGMPIEQLQCLLGHQRIDTTLQYAMVKQSNVKLAHRRYIG